MSIPDYEVGPYFVDTGVIATPGTPQALTARIIHCSSVNIKGTDDNTGNIEIADPVTGSKLRVLSGGQDMTLPITDPRLIKVDGDNGTDTYEWVAV